MHILHFVGNRGETIDKGISVQYRMHSDRVYVLNDGTTRGTIVTKWFNRK